MPFSLLLSFKEKIYEFKTHDQNAKLQKIYPYFWLENTAPSCNSDILYQKTSQLYLI